MPMFKVDFKPKTSKKVYSRTTSAPDGLGAMNNIIELNRWKYPRENWKIVGLKQVYPKR